MFDLTKYEDAEALSFGMISLVGVMANKFPLDWGNYFSVLVGDTNPTFLGGTGQEYEIVNMWYENLKHLIDKGEVSFPIKIKLLTKRCAIVVDPRVNPNYLCEITYRAPMEFWSLTALTKRQMEIDSGVLKVIDNGDGMILESREIKTKNRTLETNWVCNEALGPTIVNNDKMYLFIDSSLFKNIEIKSEVEE